MNEVLNHTKESFDLSSRKRGRVRRSDWVRGSARLAHLS